MTTKASPSSKRKRKSVDDKRLDKLESLMTKLAEQVGEIAGSAKPNILPRVKSPDAQLEVFRKAKVGEPPVHRTEVQDRLNPQVKKGFNEGDFITLKPDAPLYNVYHVTYDADGKPQPVTLDKDGNPPEESTPAIGLLRKHLYVKKRGPNKGEWKHLVKFDGFGTGDAGGEGIHTSEMELCQ